MTGGGSQRHNKKKISNKLQSYTVYFIWKLLYTFRVIPPPIIRSANNCIYSIWYLALLPAAAAGSSGKYQVL